MAKSHATTAFILILATLATILVVMVIAPFAGPLFAAALLAGVLYPAQRWTSTKLGDRPGLAAGLITTLAVVTVLGPLALLGIRGTQQLAEGTRIVRSKIDEGGLESLITGLPEALQPSALELIRHVPESILPRGAAPAESSGADAQSERSRDRPADPQQRSADGSDDAEGKDREEPQVAEKDAPAPDLGELASWVGTAVQRAFEFLIDVGVLVMALFFLLAQGRHLVHWAVATMPLTEEQSNELVSRLRDVNRAVFAATLGAALAQTAIAAVGYLIVGLPLLPAALLVTLIAALVPVVGGATIVVTIGIIVWMSGDMGYGLFLIVWGLLPVALSDNLIKPLMTESSLRLPGSVIFFAMLGGITIFGPMGVVTGPLVLAFFVTMLNLMRKEGWTRA